MTMITPSYLGETIEYSSLHACRSTLEDPTRNEIARRILALSPAEAATAAGSMPLALATVAILFLPVAAWILYWQLGSPALPDQPFAERTAPGPRPNTADPAHVDMGEAVKRLRAHLKDHHEDLTGWLLFARSELSLAGYQEAAEAYGHAAELSENRADIMGDWGEAQVLAAGGTVTPAARAAFEAGLRDAEAAPRSRYYLAFAELQAGNVKEALDAWVALAADAPADADWLPLVRQRITQAAGALGIDPATLAPAASAGSLAAGARSPEPQAPAQAAPQSAGIPSSGTVASAAQATAGASPEERQAMINAMVERLAARLETQPDDVDGWTRLGRSYMVLNQPDKAREAYARAVKLKPGDPELARALAEASTAASTNTSGPK